MHDARDNTHTRADTPTNPSRRGLLARGTAALLAGTAIATAARGAPVAPPAGAGDDAELLRLHREFFAQTAVVESWNRGGRRGRSRPMVGARGQDVGDRTRHAGRDRCQGCRRA
jgi:hypothetical protein